MLTLALLINQAYECWVIDWPSKNKALEIENHEQDTDLLKPLPAIIKDLKVCKHCLTLTVPLSLE